MKKKLSLLLMLLLILSLAVTLVACTPSTPPTGDDPDDGGDPEIATFSVTFDSDGGTSLSDFNTKVEYGQTVAAPSRNGIAVIPTKTGYTFNGWTVGTSSTAFDFSNTQITADTTIRASWLAKTYSHTVSLTDGENVDPSTVSLKNTVGDDLTALTTTYNVKGSLQIPEITDPDDYFVYWYYKEDGENIPLTVWATKGLTGNIALLNSYTLDKELTIYAMWHSCLPEYNISYDANGGNLTSSTGTIVKENDGVEEPAAPTRVGYEFDYWYYINTVDDVDAEVKFVFDDKSITTDNYTEVSENMTLYAKWQRKIEVTSSGDLEAIRTALNDDNADNDYEYTHANIYIKSNLVLSSWTALFTAENPFEGKLDGANYGEDGITVEGKNSITISSFVATENMSFLGYNNGEVKNLTFNYTLNVTSVPESVGSNVLYVGAIASINNGSISGVSVGATVRFTANKDLVCGGIVAENRGGNIDNCSSTMTISSSEANNVYLGGIAGVITGGIITNSSTTFTASTVNSTILYAGGIAGSVTGGSLTKSEVVGFTGNALTANYAYVGGAIGSLFNVNADQTLVRTAKIDVTAIEAFIGGAIGDNTGNLTNCEIGNVEITSSASSINASGGIIGRNYREGNNRARLQFALAKDGIINATATDEGKAYVGAAIGQTQGGNITMIFTAIQINVTVSNETTDNYAIGNMVGKNGSGSFENLFRDSADIAKLNGADYLFDEIEGSGNFKLTTVEDELGITVGDETIRSEAWVKANLSLNPDYDANNPDADKYIWTLSSGTAPTLTFGLSA